MIGSRLLSDDAQIPAVKSPLRPCSEGVDCNLAIQQVKSPFVVDDKGYQRDFTGVFLFAKHGFTKKDPAQRKPINTADQLVVNVDFKRMCNTHLMQTYVGGFHISGDPGSRFPGPWLGAGFDDLGERPVNGQRILTLVVTTTQATGDMNG